MNKLKLNKLDKILFFDTDTYFNKSPMALYNMIKPSQAVLFRKECLIYSKRRFSVYVKSLQHKKFNIEGKSYELSILNFLCCKDVGIINNWCNAKYEE